MVVVRFEDKKCQLFLKKMRNWIDSARGRHSPSQVGARLAANPLSPQARRGDWRQALKHKALMRLTALPQTANALPRSHPATAWFLKPEPARRCRLAGAGIFEFWIPVGAAAFGRGVEQGP